MGVIDAYDGGVGDVDDLAPTRPPGVGDPSQSGTTRGFLFCDLRDYTAFAETNGDRAAADLLTAYRVLVREALASTGGGEIRTEGDSFYVVFSSLSAAVRCGLAIVETAARSSSEEPARPIRVGVGIHAGESVEDGDGFVGSAVNVAARVCSVAAPGEVLVTDTVRSLVRTTLDVSFRSRGRPRLKGIAEPYELFAVSPTTVASRVTRAGSRSSGLRRWRYIAAGAGVVVIIGLVGPLAGLVLMRPTGTNGSSPSPTVGSGGSTLPTPSPSETRISASDLPGAIVYLSRQIDGQGQLRHQVWWAYPDGSHADEVSDLFFDVDSYAPSVDSRRIAYSNAYGVWVGTLDGAAPVTWPGASHYTSDTFDGGEPLWPAGIESWLADGDLLLMKSVIGAYDPDLKTPHRVLDAGGGAVRPIGLEGTDAEVSPSGREILVARDVGGGEPSRGFSRDRPGDLWVVPFAGEAQIDGIQLTHGFDVFAPAWSPDGQRIAFDGLERATNRNGIWTIGVNGAGLEQVSRETSDSHPWWSPDRQWIVFSRVTGNVSRLWVMRADGTDAMQLPIGEPGEHLEEPTWLPAP